MTSISREEFFAFQTERSNIKATIVAKYLYVWSKILIAQFKENPGLAAKLKRVAYVDLFAGPGRYEDGKESTPLLVLQRAISEPDLARYLHLVFNEKQVESFEQLKEEVAEYPGVKGLHFPPFFMNHAVGGEVIRRFLAKSNRPPMLVFADPWGYNGLSIELFASVLRNWGCEVIFFFNYRRINPALSNHVFQRNMALLFGEEKSVQLRQQLTSLRSSGKLRSFQREQLIVAAVEQALKDALAPHKTVYTVDYRFRDEHGTRTTHHLIFATTNTHGLAKMKEVMAGASSSQRQNVSLFEYNPQDQKPATQLTLLEPDRPLDRLASLLSSLYAGRTMKVADVYHEHQHTGKYIERNYKDAIRMLEREGRIKVDPDYSKRPKRLGEVTLSGQVQVYFPNIAGNC